MRALALAVALAGTAAWAEDGPSFDCAQAATAVEAAVCASPDLAALDRELARVYGLAAEGGEGLRDAQRRWIADRDACGAGGTDLGRCVADAYAVRILEIREGWDAARADEAGDSLGPYVYACGDPGAGLSAVYVNTPDPLVALRWGGTAVALPRAPAASGARYAGETPDGALEFWTKGPGARFTTPDGAVRECREAER